MKEYKSVYTWGKRVKAVVMLSVLLIYVVSSFYMALEVEAKLIGDYEKIDNNKVMKQKIKDEVNNKTKHLKEDIEEKLNMQGIFDIEIEGLAQEDLDIINNGDNMAVATSYYYVDENNNEIECSEEQIEKLIDEIYYDGEFSRESKNGIVKKLGEKIGILPMTAYAETVVTKTKNKAISSNEIMKKSIIVTQFMSNNVTYATATYMCTWLTTPVDRGVDAMALKCTGGKTSASDAHVAYYVYDKTVEIIEQWPYSKVVSTVTETAKKDNRTEVLWNNIGKYEAAFWFDLKDDESERIGEMYTNPIDGRKWYKISRTSYTNHRAYMRLWLKKTDSAIDFYGEYEHSTKTYKFDTIDLVLNLANSDDIIDAIMAVYDGVKKEMVTEEIGRTIVFEYIYK